MNTPHPLPVYSDEALAASTTNELLELLARDEDRVPRNVIDICARRGNAMVAALRDLLDRGSGWGSEDTSGHWWRLLHAVMILGLIPTEAAGLLLVQYMRRMSEEDDDNLQDWLVEHWPALFGNKPASLINDLRALRDDRDFDWYIRAGAMDVVVRMARREGPAALDDMLEQLAAAARDETENWDFRMFAANTLLDFPRPQYRGLLDTLAKRQPKLGAFFREKDVAKAYAEARDSPEWQQRRQDPWSFYDPQAIAQRQERWAKEDQEEREQEERWITAGESLLDVPEPIIRATPKIGRNDPCPCGSGKKYKKCCLNRETSG